MNLPITFVIFAQICFVVSTKRDKNSSDQSNELISFQQRTVFEKWMVNLTSTIQNFTDQAFNGLTKTIYKFSLEKTS